MPYLTPDPADFNEVCRVFTIPAGYSAIVMGALSELTNVWNWELDNDPVADAISKMQTMIDDAYASECAPVFTFPGTETQVWRQGRVKGGNDTVLVQQSTQIFGGYWWQSPAAQNDIIEFETWLAKGVYSVYLIGQTSAQSGIAHFIVNGTTQANTLDFYSASAVANVEKVTTITLDIDGVNLVRVKAATKNASSTNYRLLMSAIMLKWLSAS